MGESKLNIEKSSIVFILVVLLFLMASLLTINTSNAATPLYVNGSSGNDSWDGMSPVYLNGTYGPMQTIQTAVNAVDTGGTVNVAEGNYAENLVISKNLNLVGSGQNLTFIDGKDSGSVVTISSGFYVQITNLTIYNGTSTDGGGIYNEGTLTITNSKIIQNVANGNGGAICNYGQIDIYNSNLDENQAGNVGGAIFNTASATLNIENSTLYRNSATGTGSWGGAICNDGTVTINNSQFIENIAGGHGGAISNYNGVVTVTQSIFSRNNALSGAILNYGGTVNAHYNSIVGNAAPDFYNAAGTFNAEYNWWGQNSGPQSGQISGTVPSTPWLYMTFTAYPNLVLEGSTSILTANFNNACYGLNITSFDPAGGHLPDGCAVTFSTDRGSIGSTTTTNNGIATATLTADEGTGKSNITAQLDNQILDAEVEITDTLYVNGTSGNDTWNGLSPIHIDGITGPMKTIQTAINAIQTSATVNVASGTYNEHITINKNLNLIGEHSETTVIDGTNTGRVIYITPGNNVNITHVSLVNGNPAQGGAIYNYGNLMITDSILTGNIANYGGAIYNRQGTLTIIDSILTGNNVNYDGGAIYIYGGTVTITNTTFTSNTAGYIYNNYGYGGAICNYNGTLNVTSSNFTGNNAGHGEIGYDYAVYGYGGAISNKYGVININNTTLSSNTAYEGGAIYSENISNIVNSTITGNTATVYGDDGIGGGIYSIGTTNITNSNITSNTASNAAGGLYTNGNANINYSNILYNTASNGGGIYVGASGNLNISNSNISNNTAWESFGGIINSGTISVSYCDIYNNSARSGGGIVSMGTMDITYSNITNNRAYDTASAYGEGGGIAVSGPTNISNSSIINNTAARNGGGIYIDGFAGNIYITNCTIINNTATNGGGIYSMSDPGSFYVYINNSTLTNNTAINGGALFNYYGTIIMHFNRIAGNPSNTIYSSSNYAIVDGQYNWWGSNFNPSSQFAGIGTVNCTPWLYMTFTADPTLILNGSNSQLNVSFNNAYNGTDVTTFDPDGGHLPDGCGVTFTTDLGSVGSDSTIKNIINGIATATLTADEGTGTADLTAQLDNQILNTTVEIIDTLYVNGISGNDLWDGLSPTFISGTTGPMKTIQTAINAICSDGTIYVANGTYIELLTINKNLNLIGDNRNTIIDGNNTGTVIILNGSPIVTITGVTVTGGNGTNGGAIYNEYATVTITDCFINGNTANYGGAIYNYPFGWGTINIINSTVSGNTATTHAGAIYNYAGTLNISNSTINGNSAGSSGGAIFNGDTVNITNSTLSGNHANFTGGGAIYNMNTVTITNSTINGNNAYYGGAIYNSQGTLTMTGSVITENAASYNGGVIYNDNTATSNIHFNSIVGNTPETITNNGGVINAENSWWGTNQDPSSQFAGTGTINYNPWIVLTIDTTNDLIGTGETTTIRTSLKYNSAGQDTSSLGTIPNTNILFNSDTLGTLIPTNGTITNGQNTTTTFTATTQGLSQVNATVDNQNVNTTIRIMDRNDIYVATDGNDDTGNGSPDYPFQTIAKAITEIQTTGTIHINKGTYAGVNNTNIFITKNITIQGQNQESTIINGTDTNWIFNINSGINLTLNNLTITNANPYPYYNISPIYNAGTLTLTNITFTGNTGTNGGTIYNEYLATCTVNNSTFTYNTATDSGAIANQGTLTVTNSTFTHNKATYTSFDGGYGGAITNYYGCILNVTGNTFTHNTANYGGAICNIGVTEAHFNRFIGNTDPSGQEIFSWDGTVNATDNWWGNNLNPASKFGGPGINYTPWLYMNFTANPIIILNGTTSQLTADFNNIYNGTTVTPIDPSNGHLPDNQDVTFASDSNGSVDPATGKTLNGIATTTYTAGLVPGLSTVNAIFDNQNLSTVITIGNLADLLPLDIQIPIDMYVNKTYTINSTIKNQGTLSATSFTVKIFDGSTQIGKKVVNSLAADASILLNFTWKPTTNGTHTLTVYADYYNNILESNKYNNQLTQSANVTILFIADLIPLNIDTPTNFYVNNTSTITSNIKNQGTLDAGTFTVKLFDGTTQIAKYIITNLAAGSTTQATFNWKPTTSGTHNLIIYTDTLNQINESNKSNNVISKNVTATLIADLIPLDLQTPSNIYVNNTYTVTSTIKNQGTLDAGTFTVKLFDGPTQIAKYIITNLAAGSTTQATFNWKPTTSGTHNLIIYTDTLNQVNESTKNNNQISKNVTVNALLLADLSPLDLQIPSNVYAGNTYTINSTITNQGTLDAGTFTVKIFDESTQIGKIVISSLGVGENTILSFNWTPITTETHTIKLYVDYYANVSESNEINNIITQDVIVA